MNIASIAASPSQPQSGPAAGAGREVSTVACAACKARKSKCDGVPGPCSACIKRHTDCVFDTSLDLRRKVAMRQRAQKASFTKRLVSAILKTIRSGGDAPLAELIRVIRSGASPKDIMDYFDSRLEDMRERTPENELAIRELEGVRNEALVICHSTDTGNKRRKTRGVDPGSLEAARRDFDDNSFERRMDAPLEHRLDGSSQDPRGGLKIYDLVERTPLFQVPAKSWTTIHFSNRLISHLTSLYFTWWNPFWRPIVQDTFIAAMRSQDVSGEFCSPLLVNAILALGSQFANSPAVYVRQGDIMSRGESFHDEAERLWAAEEGRASLANLQALHVLLCDNNLRGRDKEGWAHMNEIIQMYTELGLSDKLPPTKVTEGEETQKVCESFRQIAWACFNVNTLFCLIVLRPVSLHAPSCSFPFSEKEANENTWWTPYPHHEENKLGLDMLVNATCAFTKCCAGIIREMFYKDGSLYQNLPRRTTEAYMADLIGWRDNLPESLELSPTAAHPTVELHAMWYSAVIMLHEFVAKPEMTLPGTPTRAYAMYQKGEAIRQIEEMIPIYKNYCNMNGYEHIPPHLTQVAVLGCNLLIASPSFDQHHEIFSELCSCMIASRRRFAPWKGTVLMLRQTANNLGVKLPQTDERRLAAVERDFWNFGRRRQFTSIYPNYAFLQNAFEDESFEMGELLDKWSRLRTDD